MIVRFDGEALDVFHETGTERYHAAMIDKIGIEPSEAQTGEVFVVGALRHGCRIPVRFEGAEREALKAIIAKVRAAA